MHIIEQLPRYLQWLGEVQRYSPISTKLNCVEKLVNKSISFRGIISSRCSYPFGDKAIFYKLDIPRNKFLLELQIYFEEIYEN